ncbi:POLIIIAc domain-containing protein [Mucor velutinosus]|uniref:POLIIIAc domain-containing protein n=1 Tax=Mucor velutinosus TaxID=708070 RepID=A0AAN7DFF8_9FUNG|nr:POLIIIAc domain-containing protein [Mucor velutinosus]
MLTIDTFPDEIIIQILLQPTMDLRTLIILMTVSSKLRRLAIHALTVYRLPRLQLLLTVEQEGKSRITTSYKFSLFHTTSLTVLLTAHHPKPRRYYTSKACPAVRSMALNTINTATSSAPGTYYPQGARKLSAQKEGFHILQASSWQLAYQITNIQKPEYYLTPVSIAIKFSHLVTLESVNRPVDHHHHHHRISSFIKLNKMKKWAAGRFST